MSAEIIHGDCREVLRTLDADSIDAVVTDPPYGLAFMGKAWDHGVPGVEFWTEALRVAKPGAHLVAFGGTRTYHRLTCAIEDAGWEIRDCLVWLYGSGFPKSLDVSKAIDKAAGAEREVTGTKTISGMSPDRETFGANDRSGGKGMGFRPGELQITAPATDAAKQWDGWGTALKPAFEPIILARKPLIGTVAANVQEHGTGALNIDGCRIPGKLEGDPNRFSKTNGGEFVSFSKTPPVVRADGRWPANVVLDEEAAALLDKASGEKGGGHGVRGASSHIYGGGKGFTAATGESVGYGDSGGASRFYYCSKASRAEREGGLSGMPVREYPVAVIQTQGVGLSGESLSGKQVARSRNHHPTVKPVALMRWLVRLVTPPDGLVLDPFTGSGTTGCAAMLEGCRFMGIELDADYAEIARARIAHHAEQTTLSMTAA